MSEPKKHHFLPQFYLRAFEILPRRGKVPHLWVHWKKEKRDPISPSVEDTACVRDYHTIELDNDEKDRATLENVLSKTETLQAALITRVIDAKSISKTDKIGLSWFIAIMQTRVPSFKNMVRDSLRLSVLSLGNLMHRHGKLPPIPKELEYYMKGEFSDNFDIDIANRAMLGHMFGAALQSGIAETIYNMSLSILEACGSATFVTSDPPVSVYHPIHSHDGSFGVGMVDREVEVFLPLSPTVGLLWTWKVMPPYKKVKEETEEYNRRTIISASDFVYSSVRTPTLDSLIDANRERSAGFRVDRIDQGDGFYLVTRYIAVTRDENY